MSGAAGYPSTSHHLGRPSTREARHGPRARAPSFRLLLESRKSGPHSGVTLRFRHRLRFKWRDPTDHPPRRGKPAG